MQLYIGENIKRLRNQFAGGFSHIEDSSACTRATAHALIHSPEHKHPHQNQDQRENEPLQYAEPVLLILYDDLHLLIRRHLCIKLSEHLFGIEASGDEENEMRRFFRQTFTVSFFVLMQTVRLDGDHTLIFISDKGHRLYVSCKPLLLHFIPFLLRRGSAILSENAIDDGENNYVVDG